jgi:type VI secretion system protein ImpG
MTDQLLPYYNRELTFLRRLGAEFAQAHPKIAGRLRLGPDASEDPHVERLVQAFAYLSARIRHKLDDDFPELSEALLGVLYPHYQAPIPSMAIVQLIPDPEQAELSTGLTVGRHAMLETEPIDGEPCRFRTCYPVTLWPIELVEARLDRPPFQAPTTPASKRAASVLCLRLRCRSGQMTFPALPLDTLRFFLNGQYQHVFPLYEMLFNNVLEVALATGPNDPAPILLPPESIRPVGFGCEEGMLPYSARSFLGYRLLTEFFAFPEKYLFVDLAGLQQARQGRIGNQLDIYFFLNRASADLQANVSADNFQLGCTPIVNLYRQRAEPIQLSHTQSEYAVILDSRRPLAHEVYSIDRVTALSPGGEVVEFRPFYSTKHADGQSAPDGFWHATRRSAGPPDAGTDISLSLVDVDLRTAASDGWTLEVETTCLNRDLPCRLPFGGDQPRLQLTDGGALVGSIRCLTAPTPPYRLADKKGAMWRLISHLSLNHLSLLEREDGASSLREILTLYDFTDSEETRSMIGGVLHASSRRVVGRTDGSEAICRGTEIAITLDETRFAGSGLFLFASVLEHFLGLYCSMNSFTRLVASIEGREGTLRRWPPRMGERVLI